MSEIECPDCHRRYDPKRPGQITGHSWQHRRWREATLALGYTPEGPSARAETTQRAKAMQASAATDEALLESLLLQLRVMFDASLSSAILDRSWPEHPSFEDYTSRLPIERLFRGSDRVIHAIRTRFPSAPPEACLDGTVWTKPGRWRSMRQSRTLLRSG